MEKYLSALELPREKLQELKLLGYDSCQNVDNSGLFESEHWNNINRTPITKTAFEIFQEEQLEKQHCIINDLDSILKNEILPGRIVELCGAPGSGKTQLCYLLSVGVQLPKSYGGAEKECFFISTNKNFASHRLREIAQMKNGTGSFLTVNEVLSRIHCIETSTPVELIACTKILQDWFKQCNRNIGILIIDSIAYIIRQVEPLQRASVAYKILRSFQSLSNCYKFAVVVTNDLTTKVNGRDVTTVASFGESFYHIVNTRIFLSKIASGVFNAKLLKSSVNSYKEVNFTL